MKNKIFAVLFLLVTVMFSTAQKLNFKDKNFEKAAIENYDINKDGFIDGKEALQVSNLFLVKKGITSADDLVFFSQAKMVVLDDNSISTISLKNLDALQLFSCTNCRISTFRAENLKNLVSVYVNNNFINNIFLKGLPRINQLAISLNQLKAIDVSDLRNLKKLNLEHNQLQKLDISRNYNLKTLNIGGNKMKETAIHKGSQTDLIIFGAAQ